MTIPQASDASVKQKSAWEKMSTIKDQPLFIVASAVFLAFSAGLGAYQFVLGAAQLDVVREGTYIYRTELGHQVLRDEAIREITRLIEVGEALKTDDAKIHAWILESRTFVHYIGLEKDSNWKGQKVSNAEQSMLWALEDPSIEVQVQKTIGVFRGLRAAFSSKKP